MTIPQVPTAEKKPQIVVFLGDSITDGHTLVLHVEQALAAAGVSALCFNAGVAGDRADQMLARLARDVLPLQPTTVCLSAGINDAMQGITPAVYRDHLTALIREITASGARLIVLTPTAVAAQHPNARLLVTAYREIIAELTRVPGVLCADVGAAMSAAQAAGAGPQLAPDGIHLEEPGYCSMAATVLAMLGHPHGTLPPRPRWEPLAGLLTSWRIALADHGTAATVTHLVPESPSRTAWWEAQEQARGYAWEFITQQPGSAWIADTILPPGPAGRLAVGGQITRITLDDVECIPPGALSGWHVRPVAVVPARTVAQRLRLSVSGPFTAAVQVVPLTGGP